MSGMHINSSNAPFGERLPKNRRNRLSDISSNSSYQDVFFHWTKSAMQVTVCPKEYLPDMEVQDEDEKLTTPRIQHRKVQF